MHQRVRVLGDVAPALVEELKRQRHVRRIDVIDVAQVRGVRDAVLRAREELRREQSLKTGGERFERDASWHRRPRRGSRRLLEDAVAFSANRHRGPRHPVRRLARDADDLETRRGSLRTAFESSRARSASAGAHARRTSPFTWQARSSIGRPNDTAAWPLAFEVGHQPRRRDLGHVHDEVRAVGLDADGERRARRSARGASLRVPMWMPSAFLEKGGQEPGSTSGDAEYSGG